MDINTVNKLCDIACEAICVLKPGCTGCSVRETMKLDFAKELGITIPNSEKENK